MTLVLASGCAFAQVGIDSHQPFGDGGALVPAGTPVVLDANARAALADAFAWQVRDQRILGSLGCRHSALPLRAL